MDDIDNIMLCLAKLSDDLSAFGQISSSMFGQVNKEIKSINSTISNISERLEILEKEWQAQKIG